VNILGEAATYMNGPRCRSRPDSPQFKQLMLQIEMDLFALARWQLLLPEDDTADLPPLTRRTPRNRARRRHNRATGRLGVQS
jgi:hypothetical protein